MSTHRDSGLAQAKQPPQKGDRPDLVGADAVHSGRGSSLRSPLASSPAPSTPYIPLTLVSDRAGLVMEPGAKVKLRGVQVGQVALDRVPT